MRVARRASHVQYAIDAGLQELQAILKHNRAPGWRWSLFQSASARFNSEDGRLVCSGLPAIFLVAPKGGRMRGVELICPHGKLLSDQQEKIKELIIARGVFHVIASNPDDAIVALVRCGCIALQRARIGAGE